MKMPSIFTAGKGKEIPRVLWPNVVGKEKPECDLINHFVEWPRSNQTLLTISHDFKRSQNRVLTIFYVPFGS